MLSANCRRESAPKQHPSPPPLHLVKEGGDGCVSVHQVIVSRRGHSIEGVSPTRARPSDATYGLGFAEDARIADVYWRPESSGFTIREDAGPQVYVLMEPLSEPLGRPDVNARLSEFKR